MALKKLSKRNIIITLILLFLAAEVNAAAVRQKDIDIALTGVSGWATLPVAFSTGNGAFNVTNYPISGFAGWAATANVKVLPGDYNGDGRTDIALTGGTNWTKLPVAFSNGDGTFNVTNLPIGNFAGWAATPKVRVLTGDFNGDGKTDIALTGGSNWTKVPIAFSNGNGTFKVTDLPLANFVGWAKAASVKILTGDFNGDGRTDIALTGPNGWTSIPIAFSNGNGTFNVATYKTIDFAAWAAAKNVKVLTGDFNGDGKTDLALTGVNGWATLPVAFSKGDGTFAVTNQQISNFAGWAASANVRIITGDLNGDKKTDVALTGVNGWATLPVAFSNGNGTFSVTNQPIGNFASWAATPTVRIITGDFNGDKRRDIALTGVKGWGSIPVAFSNGNGAFTVTNQPITNFAGWAASANVRVLTGYFN